ncbi:glycosyltransferase [Klebsiella quasipneumoniae]|jgi:glycosyltransferase involved in cell wall biosynthesis|uniref:glycosyltransferase n=1 Tax=Klebsiella TaxID=570 RepID=UPI00085182CC|nr:MULTISPECIES: glycosyltransferase [Klebsiella]UKB70678.1 glycosyltransferase [Klebsiella sp. PCX]ULD74777.1 glycosyltransferase [Klebsiella quasipneumoniae subsp. similipneumoniae]WHA59061.1 glycosyltransferase [Klebsiella quasipneumoniae]WHA63916.1 glycosyltransferase [Klebsiella quasipneumoniae]WHA68763.1 glycosyltransferase [Klebsiella quasipneumoniae]
MSQNVIFPMLSISNHGGVRILLQIANSIANKGGRTKIICPKGTYDTRYNISDKVEIIEIGPAISNKICRWFYFTILFPFYVKNNDTVFANFFVTFYASLLSRILYKKIKIVYFIQDIEYEFFRGLIKKIARKLCEFSYTYKKADIVAANRYLYDQLLVKNDAIKLFNVWIDEKFITTASVETHRQYDLIYFLRQDPRKRIDRFDEMLPFLHKNNISVLCVTQSLDLAERYSSQLSVFIPENDQELISLIDKCKLYLLTSSQEGFSLPPLECMARGVIPVVFKCGGPEIYIEDGLNGFIVNSIDEASKRIFELVNSYDSLCEIKDKAVRTARKISFSEEVDALANRVIQM